jgi:hypothetical protein
MCPHTQVLQSPWLVRPLSLVYLDPSQSSADLRISPCTLAGILGGTVTRWDWDVGTQLSQLQHARCAHTWLQSVCACCRCDSCVTTAV